MPSQSPQWLQLHLFVAMAAVPQRVVALAAVILTMKLALCAAGALRVNAGARFSKAAGLGVPASDASLSSALIHPSVGPVPDDAPLDLQLTLKHDVERRSRLVRNHGTRATHTAFVFCLPRVRHVLVRVCFAVWHRNKCSGPSQPLVTKKRDNF